MLSTEYKDKKRVKLILEFQFIEKFLFALSELNKRLSGNCEIYDILEKRFYHNDLESILEYYEWDNKLFTISFSFLINGDDYKLYEKIKVFLNADKYYFFSVQPSKGKFYTNDKDGRFFKWVKVMMDKEEYSFESYFPIQKEYIDSFSNLKNKEYFDVQYREDENLFKNLLEVRKNKKGSS